MLKTSEEMNHAASGSALDGDETTPLVVHDSATGEHMLFGNVDERKRLEQRLLKKLDTRMSILVLIYILNYIDRQNIAVARLRGFEEDLKLEGSQFASCMGSVYLGYLFFQIPSNLFLEYIGKPATYLATCMILWGFISMFTRFYEAILARFCLGFLLISKWYKRDELGQRTGYLACGLLIANATGSLMASGILTAMDNVYGISAWRWLFFTEGFLTILVGIWALYVLPNFPQTSSGWLSPAEKALAVLRIREESKTDYDEEIKGPLNGFWLAISDWKVCHVFGVFFHFYFPTLMQTIGYNPTITLLICVPPWLTATVAVIIISRHSDKTSERFWHISFSFGVAVIGYLMAISTMNPLLRYISLFLMTQTHAAFVCFMAWASGSLSDTPSKRATALALINTGGILANIFVPYAWPSAWGPDYSKSFAICILATFLSATMCWVFRLHLKSLNNARHR
ncbi:sugar transporter [Gymnopus androsaceus JB14]|uniref:Sugar transporter n=1 Tax=Gymnopus androsaceus JB14 TaxID=1447944 RepID=A0A6A4I607_9AGAR|nr:sugar transporter [Gymnopus androsaceus JB14]